MTNYNNSAERALVSRAIAREGIILLENKNNTLPLGQEPVAVFGRTQIDMIQGGTGSALCTSEYCVNILTGLENAGVQVDQELASIYRKWCGDNPLVSFGVWGSGAHVNPEMPLWEDVVARASARTEKAIFVIGRTAGENDDVNVMDGDFRLSSEEKAAYEMVCKHFSNIIVVINSGNLIDLRFTQRAEVKAVVLLNLPGMEGGNALGDVLSGKFTPSGKLTDTVAYEYSDYPSSKYFGKKGGIIQNYNDDIFVGYRYFETFEHAKDKVMYPFGYGLSYTQFESRALSFTCNDSIDGMVKAEIAVKNIGNTYSGKEVIMLYSSAPKSKLGAPAYELRAFQKTSLLAPGEEEILTLTFPIQDMASFDDTGVLGTANAWVLMQGAYSVFFGNNIKKVQKIGEYEVAEDTVLKTCTALPTELTSRLTATGEIEELDAHIKSIIKFKVKDKACMDIGCYTFYPMHRKLINHKNDEISCMTEYEAKILELLLLNQNEITPMENILSLSWLDKNDYNATSCIYTHICNIRKYLKGDSNISIDVFRGKGYILKYIDPIL